MPIAEPANLTPSQPDSSADLQARGSARRSILRREAAARGRVRRRRIRTGGAALLGTMSLVAGAAAAQGQVGGVTPDAKVTTAPTLRPGDTGPGVKALQSALRLQADGTYGPQTRRAVRRWQRAHRMKADGIARPSVLRALDVDARAASAPGLSPVLERIAHCESGGDPNAVSATGRYRGKYQFSVSTWRQIGGKGDPAAAPEARQDRLAAKLFAAQGRAPWPHCGARA